MWIKVKKGQNVDEERIINTYMIQTVYTNDLEIRAIMSDGSEAVLGQYPEKAEVNKAFEKLLQEYPFRNVLPMYDETLSEDITSNDHGMDVQSGQKEDEEHLADADSLSQMEAAEEEPVDN